MGKFPAEILASNFGANLETYSPRYMVQPLPLNLNGIVLEIDMTFFMYSENKMSSL